MRCILESPLCRSCLWCVCSFGIVPNEGLFHLLPGTHLQERNVLHPYVPTHISIEIPSPKCHSAALNAIKWSMLLLQLSCWWDKFWWPVLLYLTHQAAYSCCLTLKLTCRYLPWTLRATVGTQGWLKALTQVAAGILAYYALACLWGHKEM
jgi:hypothetical protein